jgi:hypothetical protein
VLDAFLGDVRHPVVEVVDAEIAALLEIAA